MNDMSRPNSASRLSEDIGDVLGAIRRLIAEDEALDFARDALHRQHAAGDTGNDLAHRFGGPSALARKMVRDSMAPRDRPAASDPAPAVTGHPLTESRPELVADPDMLPARGGHPGLVARRDLPLRRGPGPVADARPLAPLRLGDSDRVDSVIFAGQDVDGLPDPTGPQQRLDRPDASAPLSFADARPLRDIDDRENDDFDEAFDAKSRMRPEPVALAPRDCTSPAAVEDRHPAARKEDPKDGDGSSGAADFWAAYLQAQAPSDLSGRDDQASVQGADILEVLSQPVDEPRPLAGMTIPAYPADPLAWDIPAHAGDEVITEMLADVAAVHSQIEVMPTSAQDIEMAQERAAAVGAADWGVTDEGAIRAVIREIIQEELHGELGQRFSRNLRAVIRREVAVAIDEALERI